MYCIQCSEVQVSNSTLQDLEGGTGVGIALTSINSKSSAYVVSNCTFRDIVGMKGAGVFANNVQLTLERNQFINNSAEGVASSGGAVALACDRQPRNCSYLLQLNLFANNTADLNGGAVAWLDEMPTLTTPSLATSLRTAAMCPRSPPTSTHSTPPVCPPLQRPARPVSVGVPAAGPLQRNSLNRQRHEGRNHPCPVWPDGLRDD